MPDQPDRVLPKRVLIVDDNEQNRELLSEYLEDCASPPLEIITVADGQSALDEAFQTTPDLVLLDIMMPRMSGYQVCEQLRATASTAGVPVLMITALDDEGDLERARDAGANGLMTKPVGRAELIERIMPMLDRG